jgi:hypothetical protein
VAAQLQRNELDSLRQQAANPSDGALVRRLFAVRAQAVYVTTEALNQQLLEYGCRVTRAPRSAAATLTDAFSSLLDVTASRRGLPRKAPNALKPLTDQELLAQAARRACLVARAHRPRVVIQEIQAHAPDLNGNLVAWRTRTLVNWDEALDEWTSRLVADSQSVVWSLARAAAFPRYGWRMTDRRTGQPRPTGEGIGRGELAWGEAMPNLTIEQLAELAVYLTLADDGDRQQVLALVLRSRADGSRTKLDPDWRREQRASDEEQHPDPKPPHAGGAGGRKPYDHDPAWRAVIHELRELHLTVQPDDRRPSYARARLLLLERHTSSGNPLPGYIEDRLRRRGKNGKLEKLDDAHWSRAVGEWVRRHEQWEKSYPGQC